MNFNDRDLLFFTASVYISDSETIKMDLNNIYIVSNKGVATKWDPLTNEKQSFSLACRTSHLFTFDRNVLDPEVLILKNKEFSDISPSAVKVGDVSEFMRALAFQVSAHYSRITPDNLKVETYSL